MRLSVIFLSLGLMGACAAVGEEEAPAADADSVRIMVIGTYHFGNPGQDLNNIQAASVLSPARQGELAALSETLLSFNPAVVAVERVAEPPYDDPVWPDFDAEMLASAADERVQIGYRLAAAAGIDRVYAIDEQSAGDEPSYFPYDVLSAFAEETGRTGELQSASDWTAYTQAFEAAQDVETVPALLMRTNGPDFTDDFYWNVLTLGEGERQPGAELAAYWFLRNAKIMNKLTQVTEPGDRVVVVYGAGHGHWLRQMIEEMDGYALEPVMPYLERADALARRSGG
ncbi:MAG: DUF5694 domain-containing protein [Pseudomonadota bacterium]